MWTCKLDVLEEHNISLKRMYLPIKESLTK
jgi:hypothetical protein